MYFCNFSPSTWVLDPMKGRLSLGQPTPRIGLNPTFGLPTLLVAVFILVLGRATAAEASPRAGETNAAAAQKILARYIEASGGEAAVRKQPTRLTIGSFDSPAMGVNGTIEILQATPRRMFQKLIIASTATITMGTDGRLAWINIPGAGVQQMDGLQRDQFIEENDLLGLLDFPSRYTNSVVLPPAKVGGIECVAVSGVNKFGKTETVYFGRTDGLLVRWDRPKLDPSADWANTETYYDDYREVDGIKIPFRISQKAPADQAFTLNITSVKNGVEATADRFKLPE